jgi:L-ascorbate metabolism protein UlaG (beta-lactamase superfamily)
MNLNGLEMTWLGHAAFRFRLPSGEVIYIDPWLEGNPSCPEDERHPEAADAVYVTHGHFDHFGSTVEMARAGATVYAIHEVAVYLEGLGITGVVGMNKGGSASGPGGIVATMTNAVHSAGISADNGIVPGGESAGFVLAFEGGPTMYHAGDTTVFGDMSLIGEMYQPDIGLLPIGGHFTMGPDGAARAAKLLGVSTVIPMHFGTFPILAGTPAELRAHLEGTGIEVADVDIGRPVT